MEGECWGCYSNVCVSEEVGFLVAFTSRYVSSERQKLMREVLKEAGKPFLASCSLFHTELVEHWVLWDWFIDTARSFSSIVFAFTQVTASCSSPIRATPCVPIQSTSSDARGCGKVLPSDNLEMRRGRSKYGRSNLPLPLDTTHLYGIGRAFAQTDTFQHRYRL